MGATIQGQTEEQSAIVEEKTKFWVCQLYLVCPSVILYYQYLAKIYSQWQSVGENKYSFKTTTTNNFMNR